MKVEKKEFHTDLEAKGQRLDQWLSSQKELLLSRARIQNLIKEGFVFVDGCREKKPKKLLGEDCTIEVFSKALEPAIPKAEDIPLDILYEDEDLLVLNKPAFLVVHPAPGNYEGTLVNALLYHCRDSLSGIGGVRRPGIVHRLDKNTSGVMVVAKNDLIHQALSDQFADHGREGVLERHYQALVWGAPQPKDGKIHTYLGRSRHDRLKRSVVCAKQSDAKEAITYYQTEQSFYAPFEEGYKSARHGVKQREALASLITCQLKTGRTHQIRVHMAHLHCPIIADKEYGNALKTKVEKLEPALKNSILTLERQALHAKYLRFLHPRNKKIMEFSSEFPQDLKNILQQLRASYEMK